MSRLLVSGQPGIGSAASTHGAGATRTFPVTGALAGAVSTLAFAGIHAWLIGDIWFFIAPMLIAGAVCGVSVAWAFGVLVRQPTLRRWVLYNATYIGLLAALGVISLIVYEPVTTISLLLAIGEPPEYLVAEVMPLIVGFIVGASVVVTLLFGRRWWHVGPALVAVTVVVLLLGLNISILGLVEVPASSAYLVVELFGLIVALVVVYAAVVVAVEWRTFGGSPRHRRT